ncbi:MAG: IS110 family transposase [Phycisphaerales bacterium]|nr:IS110 family transposase [Phycisphaerales bacterium]
MSKFFGLDAHKEVVQICCLDTDGKEVFNRRLPCTREALTELAKEHFGTGDELAIEATTNTWAIVELLRPFLSRVLVSNPLKTKAIAEAKVKTDKVDARVLAQLLRADFLPGVWIPDAHTQRLRRLTHRRAAITADMTGVKNRIHATLHQRLIHVPTPELFRGPGMEWLANLALDEEGRASLDSDLRVLAAMSAELELVDRTIRQEAYADGRARLLMTLPGFGVVTAVTLLSAWGDPTRFPDADHAVAYLGIVPSTRQSGSNCAHGPITKEGSSHTRWALVQAAHMAGRHAGPLGVAFRRLCRRKNYNVAVVAIARKLARIAWLMLSHGEPYRYAMPDATHAKLARLRRAIGEKRKSIRRGRHSTPAAMLAAGFHASIIPPLTEVLADEHLPAPTLPDDLPAGEWRMLRDRELDRFVREIHSPKFIPRPKRDPRGTQGAKQAAKLTIPSSDRLTET